MMPSSRPVVWSKENWPVSELAKLIRHELDQHKAIDLAESLKRGNQLPAVFVLSEGGRLTILDGHHRVMAWHMAGVPTAPVIVGRVQ